MNVEIQINNSPDPLARYVTWSPSPCRVRVSDPSDATSQSILVRLSAASSPGGGEVRFRKGTTGPFTAHLDVTLQVTGQSESFYIAGTFGRASTQDGDITVAASAGSSQLGSVPLMVRIRKNAESLTVDERERFVAALAKLNNQGTGRFVDFRDMHVATSYSEAHGAQGFLPWHRAYVLDLERELQSIDPSVALPYWRFDQPAPTLFTADFLGDAEPDGTLRFSATNPLAFWRAESGIPGIDRGPKFNTITGIPPLIIDEAATIGLGTGYAAFRDMEDNPHGYAHVGFDGPIDHPFTAPRDPLFFLLHCNVDRLWAKWQKQNSRFDAGTPQSYEQNMGNRIGHRLDDTMWPWNQDMNPPRPPMAPGGPLAQSISAAAPGPSPRVRDCLDYKGLINASARMGFDYDDVPN